MDTLQAPESVPCEATGKRNVRLTRMPSGFVPVAVIVMGTPVVGGGIAVSMNSSP
jgi:hypothetical protein